MNGEDSKIKEPEGGLQCSCYPVLYAIFAEMQIVISLFGLFFEI